jgi:hypothetical protein
MLVTLVCFLSLLLVTRGIGQELQPPSVPSTIEELTNGKVKIGDHVTKDNVDMVREYVSPGLYECVRNGMVLKMGTHPPPEKMHPKTYVEATERNKGKAIVDDHMVVRYQDGSEWPGGVPFIEPTTAQELMGNYRFGMAYDNYEIFEQNLFVNKEGNCYKKNDTMFFNYWTDGRLKVPPLGSVPGQEDYHRRFIAVTLAPLEVKGSGMLQISFDDNTEHYDIGFIYNPQFKRTIRISAATFQDNYAVSDFTYGDPEGLLEPFGFWNFRLIDQKLMLTAELIRDRQPTFAQDGLSADLQVEWDVGKRFPRLGWVITPLYVVEATSKESSHIYSKKVLYLTSSYYAQSTGSRTCVYIDIYNRKGEMWKLYYDWRGGLFTHKDGEHYTFSTGFSMHNLQTGHQTHLPMFSPTIDGDMKPDTLSLKRLLELGK